jgi:hypothetical protein
VPSFVTFPFVFTAFVAWQKIKSNKNASFTQDQKNRSVKTITLRFCRALFRDKTGRLTAQTKLFNKRFIGTLIAGLDIIQQATALANHCQQTTTRSEIFFMCLQMFGQIANAL